jgi:hypothetical protein
MTMPRFLASILLFALSAEAALPAEYVVKAGDTLTRIAESQLGSSSSSWSTAARFSS